MVSASETIHFRTQPNSTLIRALPHACIFVYHSVPIDIPCPERLWKPEASAMEEDRTFIT